MKPITKALKKPQLINLKAEEKKSPKKEVKQETKKPPKYTEKDEYKDLIEPIDIEIPDEDTRKFVVSVKRGGEFGLPMCDLRQKQMTDLYTGFTKKGINFPIELLPDIIEVLQVVYSECEELGLYK